MTERRGTSLRRCIGAHCHRLILCSNPGRSVSSQLREATWHLCRTPSERVVEVFLQASTCVLAMRCSYYTESLVRTLNLDLQMSSSLPVSSRLLYWSKCRRSAADEDGPHS
eukprot:scaffold25411_cov33-Tisochrysis_lutea.AAC.2